MKKSDDFIKYVKRWLISHYSEFTYKPYIVRDLKYKRRYILKFSSIPNISVIIESDGTFDMWYNIKYNGKEYMENPLDLLTVIKKNNKGFYCDLCIKKTYHKTKEKIWENHLKDFIIWSKENLKKRNKFMVIIYEEEDKYDSYDLAIVSEDFNINNESHHKQIPFRFNKNSDYKYIYFPIER